jgi:hypothetical protein
VAHHAHDLYAALGVGWNASTDQLRAAYEWQAATAPTPNAREAARAAYAVLGDPRLRAQYDAGRVVGVGAGTYYEGGASFGDRGRPARRMGVSRLEQRWERRLAHTPPTRPTGRTSARRLATIAVSTLVVGVLGGVGVGAAQQITSGSRVARPIPQLATHLTKSHVIPSMSMPAPRTYPLVVTGSCYGSVQSSSITLRQPIACSGPHMLEAIKTLNVDRLLGAAQPGAEAASTVSGVCDTEFNAFTGLSGPTEDLWPLTLTSKDSTGAVRSASCLVDSRYLRTGTARGIGS